jgi:four helix bundle protein
MRDFRKLKVWEKAHELTLEVYSATARFPREELYGLAAQLRRASASIPANIAEGCGRDGEAELRRFLRIGLGSANEVEYHLLLAKDLRFLREEEFSKLTGKLVLLACCGISRHSVRSCCGVSRHLKVDVARSCCKSSEMPTM